MHPDKYLEDLESSRKRGRIIRNGLISGIFLSCFALFGPLVHELSHIAILELYRCFYYFEPGFGLLSGFHAKVTPLCTPDKSSLLLFYSSGYLSTLLVGGALSLLAIKRSRYREYFAAAGSGMLLSILLSVGIEGDIQNIVELLGLAPVFSAAIIAFISVGIFITSLRTLQIFMELERQE